MASNWTGDIIEFNLVISQTPTFDLVISQTPTFDLLLNKTINVTGEITTSIEKTLNLG